MSLLTTDSPESRTGAAGPTDPVEPAGPGAAGPARRPAHRAHRSHRVQKWSRLVHVYSSMLALVLVLFFGVTGLLLNHPGWTFGLHPTSTTSTGTLPSSVEVNGSPDLLAVSQFLRSEHGVRGEVTDYSIDATQGAISYRSPGYSADVTIDVEAETYTLDVENQGLLAILGDLHRGKATNAAWGVVIDVAAGFLVLTALAGLVLQLVLKKRRTTALIAAALGGALAAWIALTTLG